MNLREKPFYLSDSDIAWVDSTLAGMTTDEKIGQVFCLTDIITDPEALKNLVRQYHPGAFMYRTGAGREIQNAYRAMQEASDIPMLLPCNLESGGNGISTDGTYFGKPLEIAATDDAEMARRLGYICGLEGGSVGCNWAYAPIIDIDYNWRNPITNVRTFGSDPERVLRMAKAWVAGMRDSGMPMAACIKHFPGDGVDERDQHLLPTVNSLSCDAWEESYGKLYRELIDLGVRTVMVGHILQPEMTRKFCPEIADKDILPASTNRYLMTDLLRGALGFEGLITTDATPMVGFSSMMPRSEALCKALMAGADMLVFCKNIDEDQQSLRDGLRTGELTMERLDEAVRRQLALKASLGLPVRKEAGTLVPGPEQLQNLGHPDHIRWAKECADQAVTLVKDNQNLLPISPEKTPRIRLTVLGEDQSGAFGDNDQIGGILKEALEQQGFSVAMYDYAHMEFGEIFTAGVADMREKFDLSIVAANVPTGSNNTTRRIDWITLMAANEPWYVKEIPTLFLSFCNPYHMVDVPFISTFVNCYSSNRFCVEAAVEKLTGKREFSGKSPVDPWCGDVWGAKFM